MTHNRNNRFLEVEKEQDQISFQEAIRRMIAKKSDLDRIYQYLKEEYNEDMTPPAELREYILENLIAIINQTSSIERAFKVKSFIEKTIDNYPDFRFKPSELLEKTKMTRKDAEIYWGYLGYALISR